MAEKWELAFEDYTNGMAYKDIAAKYGVSAATVRSWKMRKGWDLQRNEATKPKSATVATHATAAKPKKRADNTRYLNKGPERNTFARKHGFYAKWLPDEIQEIMGETPDDDLDLLWHNIQLQQAKIIHAFKIQTVKDKDDLTTRVVSSSEDHTTYQHHEAYEKDAAFMQGLSRAMGTLNNMINSYEKILNDRERKGIDADLRRAQLDKLRAETDQIKSDMTGAQGDQVVIVDDIDEEDSDDGNTDQAEPADLPAV